MLESPRGTHGQRVGRVVRRSNERFHVGLKFHNLGDRTGPSATSSHPNFITGRDDAGAQGHRFEDIVDFAIVILVWVLGVD